MTDEENSDEAVSTTQAIAAGTTGSATRKLEWLSPEFLAVWKIAVREFDKKYNSTRAASRKLLVEEGIFTKTGRLTKNYR